MVCGDSGSSGYGGGGGKAKTFNSFFKYYPYIRRKSIMIKIVHSPLYIGPQCKKRKRHYNPLYIGPQYPKKPSWELYIEVAYYSTFEKYFIENVTFKVSYSM